jgi:alkylation response protein AidB-like acyl-CoA dehydrogenase
VRAETERRAAIAHGDWGHPAVSAGLREVTMATLHTQRAAVEVADACLQIHGGYGYAAEHGIERPCAICASGRSAGHRQIMREILGKRLGL